MATLQDIKGVYSAVFSLGSNCLPGMEMKAHGLRKFAGPIDWMGTPVLPQISRMLRNRFQGMLVYPNLVLVNQASDELYNVLDREYELYMNHDFYTHNNFPLILPLFLKSRQNMTGASLDFYNTWRAGDEFSLSERIPTTRKSKNWKLC